MALRFTDGCDSYAATADLTKKWGSMGPAWSFSSGNGVTGGGAIATTNISGSGNIAAPRGTLNSTSLAFAFRLKSNGTVTTSNLIDILQFLTATNTLLFRVQFMQAGNLQITNGNNTVTLPGTISVLDGNYHWIEIKFGSSGAAFVGAQVYIDGVLDISTTSTVQVTSGTIDTFYIFNSTKAAFFIDDIIAYDNVGNAPVFANFPLGPQIIKTIRPASDGTCTFGTVSSGTNHSAMVNEVNGDTTNYVEDNVSGHQDLYNYDSIGSPTSIVGVMVNTYMHNPGAGAINAAPVCKSGATTSAGTTVALAAGPKVYQQEYGVDPNTSAAWTATNLNAAQFGAKVA